MSVRLTPYLVMDGNAREAIAFYEKALDAKNMGVMSFGDMPFPGMPEAAKDLVMHATLQVGETLLMFSDTMPGMEHRSGTQVTITILTDSVEASTKFFEALSAGGQVQMPLQKTDWSPAYGSLTDRFGVPWQINTDVKG